MAAVKSTRVIKSKRAFRNVFKAQRAPVYKSHPKRNQNREALRPPPPGLRGEALNRFRRRQAAQQHRRYRPGSIIILLKSY